MLDVDHGQKLMNVLWEATPAKVELPESIKSTFFQVHGRPEPCFWDNKRSYHRYYMRSKAVLKRGPSLFGTYTKDVSRQGIGFFSPVALMPKEQVKLRVPAAELNLEVTRCRRVEAKCFECGAKFALSVNQ